MRVPRLLLGLGLLGTPAPVLAATNASPHTGEPADAVVEILQQVGQTENERQHAELQARLLAMGPSAVPSLFDVVAGSASLATEEDPHASLDAADRELVQLALTTWPENRVLEKLLAHVDAEAPLAEKLAAVRLVATFGTDRSVLAWAELHARMAPEDRVHPLVLENAEECLRELLVRDGSTYGALESLLPELDPGLYPACARALAGLGDWRGVSLLAKLRGQTEALDLIVLDALGQFASWRARGDLSESVEWTRSRLEVQSENVQQQAAVTLGRLGDGASVPGLLRLLEEGGSRASRGAHWSLRELSGMRWSDDASRWRSWYEAEQAWHDNQAEDLTVTACSGAVGPALEALRELGRHPIYASTIAPKISPALDHPAEVVGRATAQTLARLGDPRSLDALVDALDDDRPLVRDAAGAALRSITGHDLPPDDDAWRALLDPK